ncbi:uroporphyrinogen-III C-methyltransferase [Salinicola halimionae]|uniref:uroporphyrinogen-III C-methyltransferase n=1 Tax=Salinicola halimionae TaxID=1949081 RepID=UPI000DA1C431|nr:uroporphyrinogen-III C-methyltransferase [Salinicola halimionae]
MSKQSKDQQPPSATSSGDKQAPDDQTGPAGQNPKATSSVTPSAGDSQPSSPAGSSATTDPTTPEPAKTQPIKPDVVQPAATDAATGKPRASRDATSTSTTPTESGTTGRTGSVGEPKSTGGTKAENIETNSNKAGSGKAESPGKNDKPRTATASGAKASASGVAGKPDAASGKKSGASGKSSGSTSTPKGGAQPPAGGGSTSGNGKRDNGGRLGLLALILVIVLAIVVAVVGYRGWQKIQQQQTQLSQIGANSTTLDQLESKVGELDQNRQQNLKMMRGEFDQYRQKLDDTLDKVLKELAQQQQADPREWLHAEAEYLLRLANQRLQLERDVKGAKALLNAADERLREADNPALVPIRRAIQSELASLDSVPVIDRTGLYLALMAQQEQLARLPLKQDIEEIAAGKGDAKPTGGWRQQLATLGSELKDLVTVRRHDQPLEALITPQQESYLRQNVRLLLEQAQLALLKSEPKLYQASLDKALELVEGYYATDNDGVTHSIDKLKSLRDNEVRPELPDISQSSQLLKRFIEQRFGNGDDSRASGSQAGGSQNGGANGGSQKGGGQDDSSTDESAQGEGA